MSHPGSLDFSLFQVKLFLAVAETRSFSRAAEQMHIEQSTLSRRIAVLEQELGFQLFNREARPIRLTDEGALLCEQWKPLIGAFEHSLSMAYARQAKNNAALSVCMIDSGNQLSTVPALSKLVRDILPDITLSFQFIPIEQFVPQLLENRTDLVITSDIHTHALDHRFTISHILTVPLLACVLKSNPLSQKSSLTWSDLQSQRFVTISNPTAPFHTNAMHRLCNKHGFTPVFGSHCLNAHGLTSALQQDDEVLICEQFLRGIESPLFKLFELPEETASLCAISTADNKNPYIAPFVQILRDFYAE